MAAEARPPVWDDKSGLERLILPDGTLVLFSDQRTVHMLGPMGLGELWLSGDVTLGLLSGDQVDALRQKKPNALHSVRADTAEKDLLVVLDPGHGGEETGCIGVAGTREKRLVLNISMQVFKMLLELPDLKVIMTRSGDEHVPLQERVELANRLNANLFISIHANFFPRPTRTGVETFFHSLEASDEEAKRVAKAENKLAHQPGEAGQGELQSILADMRKAETLRDSSRLAHLVQHQLVQVLPIQNLGVRQADFLVLRGTQMAAVLVELGFLSNKQEEQLLVQKEIQARIAQAIRLAVIQYRGILRKKGIL